MSKEPKRNVYVGHRYVPKIMGEWDKAETYEGLSIVTNEGTSYTSKKRVPKGIDILNEEYWVVTGNYNAQIEEYRKDIREVEKEVNKKPDKTYVDSEIERLDQKDESFTTQLTQIAYIAPSSNGSNDTIPLQNMLNTIDSNGGGTLKIPTGTYFIETDRHVSQAGRAYTWGLDVPSNTKIILENDTVLKAIPNDSEDYGIFGMNNKKNIFISGGHFIGDKMEHLGEEGEWGHGIVIRDSSNVTIENGIYENFWGDGIYIRNAVEHKNIFILNNEIIRCRRHEITIHTGSDIFIRHNRFIKDDYDINNSKNVDYGGLNIDIEGFNPDVHFVENVYIEHNYFLCETNSALRLEKGQTNSNVVVKHNYFERPINNNIQTTNRIGLYTCNGILLENNVILSSDNAIGTEQTVRILDSKKIRVLNNEIHNGTGFSILNSSDVIFEGNKLTNIKIFSISVDNTNNAIIKANIIEKSEYSTAISVTNSNEIKLLENTGVGRTGVFISVSTDSEGISISHNTCENYLQGIDIRNSKKIMINNNKISLSNESEKSASVSISNVSETIIISNLIHISEGNSYGIRLSQGSTKNVASNNYVIGVSTAENGVSNDSTSIENTLKDNYEVITE